MFCHTIETQDQEDLKRLGDFVESIQAATRISDAAAKAHRLFLALHDIAARYVAERAVSTEEGQGSEGHPNVDSFMSALGIPPPLGHDRQPEQNHDGPSFSHIPAHTTRADRPVGINMMQQGLDGGPPLLRMGNEVELEYWLWENENIIDMLR